MTIVTENNKNQQVAKQTVVSSLKQDKTENINLEMNFGKNIGFSPNFTKTEFVTKLTVKDGMAQLGGKKKNKHGARTILLSLRESILKSFLTDCVSRKESVPYRLACIFALRYPYTFKKLLSRRSLNQHMFAELSEVQPKSLSLSGGYLKKSGMGSLKHADEEIVRYPVNFSGQYATVFYAGLVSLCNKLHLCMATLVGMVLERAYSNFSEVTHITETAIRFEKKWNRLPNKYKTLRAAVKRLGVTPLPIVVQSEKQESALRERLASNSCKSVRADKSYAVSRINSKIRKFLKVDAA